jgi:hypothetical protein
MTKKQAMPYMKLYHSYLDDLRLNKLPEPTRWRYVQLYMLAFKQDRAGDLVDIETGEPMTPGDIALLLRADEQIVQADMEKLKTAGLVSFNGNAWRIVRYAEEQVNQAEYRKAQAERQARHREKESKENLTEENQTKDNTYQSSQVNSHSDVTHESRVTDDGPDGQNISSNSSKPFSFDDYGPETIEVLKYWGKHFELSAEVAEIIELALSNGILPEIQKKKIARMAINDGRGGKIGDPVKYFLQCLEEITPRTPSIETVETIMREIEDQEGSFPRDVLNARLAENGYKPVTHDFLVENNLIED